ADRPARGESCAAPGGEPPGTHACAPSDAADCKAQCERGNGESCVRWASLDRGRARALLAQACTWGNPNGCGRLCDGGDAASCFTAAELTREKDKAALLYKRACDGGVADACHR